MHRSFPSSLRASAIQTSRVHINKYRPEHPADIAARGSHLWALLALCLLASCGYLIAWRLQRGQRGIPYTASHVTFNRSAASELHAMKLRGVLPRLWAPGLLVASAVLAVGGPEEAFSSVNAGWMAESKAMTDAFIDTPAVKQLLQGSFGATAPR